MSRHTYQGGCHCRDIRYQFCTEEKLESYEILACNCSLCEKMAYLHLIIPKKNFKLLSNWANLTNYQFNSRIAKHYFCKICGVKSFYQPRSHPDCWSINVRCIDNFADYKLSIKLFDGKNWEQNIGKIT